MKKISYLGCLGVALLSSLGCVSQIRPFEEYVAGWIGKPLAELTVAMQRPGSFASRTGWKEEQYKLPNGNLVYVSPERSDCLIHWEISSRNIIIGYRTEGTHCNWK